MQGVYEAKTLGTPGLVSEKFIISLILSEFLFFRHMLTFDSKFYLVSCV